MDTLTVKERSERMRRVRASGNRSTEWRVRAALVGRGIRGWTMHDRSLPGCPDFIFPRKNLVVFVDGCFWHGCPSCKRTLPRTNRRYWRGKIKGNQKRAQLIGRQLRRRGFRVLRVWEHEVRSASGLQRVVAAITNRTQDKRILREPRRN